MVVPRQAVNDDLLPKSIRSSTLLTSSCKQPGFRLFAGREWSLGRSEGNTSDDDVIFHLQYWCPALSLSGNTVEVYSSHRHTSLIILWCDSVLWLLMLEIKSLMLQPKSVDWSPASL